MPDETAGDAQKETGHATAQDVPLVRTEGKEYQNGAVWSVDRMLRDPRLLREQRDQTARDAEVAFGLQPSLYFYVGHACPDFAVQANAFVFVFAADAFDGASGTMTRFDTGGFYVEKIHLNRDLRGDDRKAFVAAHLLPSLVGWRDEFRAYVREYFSSAPAYVLGNERATKDDPYGRHHHTANERRAWTWEMQLHGDHDLRVGLLRLWVLYEHKRSLNQRIRYLPAPERMKWRDALPPGRLRTPDAVPHESNELSVARQAREDIASWV